MAAPVNRTVQIMIRLVTRGESELKTLENRFTQLSAAIRYTLIGAMSQFGAVGAAVAFNLSVLAGVIKNLITLMITWNAVVVGKVVGSFKELVVGIPGVSKLFASLGQAVSGVGKVIGEAFVNALGGAGSGMVKFSNMALNVGLSILKVVGWLGVFSAVAVTGIILGFAGMATAALAATGALMAMAASGGKIIQFRQTLEALAGQVGTTGTAILKAFGEGIRGVVPEMNLMQAANTALLLGLRPTTEQWKTLGAAVFQFSQATGRGAEEALNDLITGVGRGSVKLLDNLGILLRVNDAYREYAFSVGKSQAALTREEQTQAVLVATTEQLRHKLEWTKNLPETAATSWNRLTSSIINLKNTALEALARSPLLKGIMDMLSGWAKNFKEGGGIQNFINDAMKEFGKFLIFVLDMGIDILGAFEEVFSGTTTRTKSFIGNLIVIFGSFAVVLMNIVGLIGKIAEKLPTIVAPSGGFNPLAAGIGAVTGGIVGGAFGHPVLGAAAGAILNQWAANYTNQLFDVISNYFVGTARADEFPMGELTMQYLAKSQQMGLAGRNERISGAPVAYQGMAAWNAVDVLSGMRPLQTGQAPDIQKSLMGRMTGSFGEAFTAGSEALVTLFEQISTFMKNVPEKGDAFSKLMGNLKDKLQGVRDFIDRLNKKPLLGVGGPIPYIGPEPGKFLEDLEKVGIDVNAVANLENTVANIRGALTAFTPGVFYQRQSGKNVPAEFQLQEPHLIKGGFGIIGQQLSGAHTEAEQQLNFWDRVMKVFDDDLKKAEDQLQNNVDILSDMTASNDLLALIGQIKLGQQGLKDYLVTAEQLPIVLSRVGELSGSFATRLMKTMVIDNGDFMKGLEGNLDSLNQKIRFTGGGIADLDEWIKKLNNTIDKLPISSAVKGNARRRILESQFKELESSTTPILNLEDWNRIYGKVGAAGSRSGVTTEGAVAQFGGGSPGTLFEQFRNSSGVKTYNDALVMLDTEYSAAAQSGQLSAYQLEKLHLAILGLKASSNTAIRSLGDFKESFVYTLEQQVEQSKFTTAKLNTIWAGFNDKIESGFSDLFMNVTDKTQNIRQAFDDFVVGIAGAFRRMMADIVAGLMRQAMTSDASRSFFGGLLGALPIIGGIFRKAPPPVSTEGVSDYPVTYTDTQLGELGSYAHGAAFYHGQVTKFAGGGIFNRPTMFRMARGVGMAGEAGPEAAMPLMRMPSGRLGVESSGGGTTILIYNILDPAEVTAMGIAKNPNVIINPVVANYRANGPIRTVVGKGA